MGSSAVALLLMLGSGCAGVHVVERVPPRQELEPGTRVRVHLYQPRGKPIGQVVHVDADSLIIAPEENLDQRPTLLATNIRRVDISIGRRPRTGRGALVGLLAGTVGGYVALLRVCSEDCVRAIVLLALPIGGALVGAGGGALVGSLIKTERWRPVSWR